MGKNKKKGVNNSLSTPLSCSKETIGVVLKDGLNPIVTVEASKLHAHQVFDDMSECKSKTESSLKASYTLGQDDTDSIYVEEYESSAGNEEETPKLNEELPTLVANLSTKENPTKPSWSSLFKDNRKAIEGIELSVQPDCAENLFKLSEEDVSPLQETCGFSAIGYVAGKFPGKKALLDECNKWGVPFHYSVHSSGWLVFKFEDEKNLNQVLYGGPYFIFQRPLLLKKMPHLFNFRNEELCHVPVWVKLHSLPLQLWNRNALSKILSPVGKPIRTDQITAAFGSISYARALVEVDISKELVSEVRFLLPDGTPFVQHLEYEWRPTYCKHCKMIGHSNNNCKVLAAKVKKVEAPILPVNKELAIQSSVGAEKEKGVECTTTGQNCPRVSLGNTNQPSIEASSTPNVEEDTNVSKVPQFHTSSSIKDVHTAAQEDGDADFVKRKRRNRNKAIRSPSTGRENDGLHKGLNGKASHVQGRKGPEIHFVGEASSHQKQ